ncbi:N-methyltryptophan oxidase [Labrys miyagiensis]
MGSMAAWRLAKRGVSVLGFDQFAPGHDQSGAGGESRIFRTAYKEGAKYVPLLLRARELWRELEAETGIPLLTLNGGLMMGRDTTPGMVNVLATAESFNLDHEILTPRQVADRYPVHRLDPGEIAILDKAAGFLKPELAVLTAAAQAERLGARLMRYTKIRDIEPDANGVTLHSDNASWRVGKLLVTAGAWTRNLLVNSADDHKVVRIVLAWYVPKRPELFSPEAFPIFIREKDEIDFCGWPMVNGTSVKIGRNGSHGIVADADLLDRSVDASWMVRWRRMIERYLPDLHPHPVRIGAYMDGWTASGDPFIGPQPELPNTFSMYGFSGHGFKMAPALGEVAADLVTGAKSNFDLSPFAIAKSRYTSSVPRQIFVP